MKYIKNGLSVFENYLLENRIDWAIKAVEYFLTDEFKKGNFDLFEYLIQSPIRNICAFPLANYFQVYSIDLDRMDSDVFYEESDFFNHILSDQNLGSLNIVYESILVLERLKRFEVCEIIVKRILNRKRTLSVYNVDFYTKIIIFLRSATDQLAEFKEVLSWIDINKVDRRLQLDIDSQLFKVYKDSSMLTDAKRVVLKCLKYEKEVFGESHEYVAYSYRDLGLIELKLGKGNSAKGYFLKSLNILKKIDFNPQVVNILIFYLGISEMHNENFKKAIYFFKKLIKIRLVENGRFSTEYTEILGHLGISLFNLNNDDKKGIYFIIKSYKINNKIISKKNKPNTSLIPFISRHLFDCGDVRKAKLLLKKNLVHRKILFGEDSLETSFSYCDLYEFYSDLEDWDKAIFYSKKALIIFKNFNNFRFDYIIKILSDLALFYYKIEDFKNSLIFLEKELQLLSQDPVFFEEYLLVLEDYSWILFEVEEFEASLKNLSFLLENNRKSNTYFLIAACYELLGDSINSRIYFDLVLEPIDLKYYNFLFPMGISFFEKTNYDKSLTFLFLTVRAFFESRLKDFDTLAQIYFYIAQCYYCLNKKDKAIYYYLKSFFLLRRGGTLQIIGSILESDNSLDKALKVYLLAAKVRKERVGVSARETRESVFSVLGLADQLGKYEVLPSWIQEFKYLDDQV
jgi:tetratricopeptide (TPR) repeat protein